MLNNRFRNLNQTFPKGLIDILKWKLSSRPPKWPDYIEVKSYDVPPHQVEGTKVRISFIGHVTFLIQACGINILTDPVYSDRASPFTFIGPKRVTPPGVKFEQLPKIDLILISHNHYDHLDIETLKKLCARDNPHIITPLINDIVLKLHIPEVNVTTLNWFETTNFKDDFCIYLEPAQHWSARGLFDRNQALWGTFIIKIPFTPQHKTICFIGDTGYDAKLFKDIGKKFEIDVSLIPIGAFEPRWFMKDVHVNPEEAVLIHQDLKSKFSIASHFDTFPLADDKYNQASKELNEARIKYNIAAETFITPNIGSSYWF